MKAAALSRRAMGMRSGAACLRTRRLRLPDGRFGGFVALAGDISRHTQAVLPPGPRKKRIGCRTHCDFSPFAHDAPFFPHTYALSAELRRALPHPLKEHFFERLPGWRAFSHLRGTSQTPLPQAASAPRAFPQPKTVKSLRPNSWIQPSHARSRSDSRPH